MTVIEKLSDRHSLIYEAIILIIKNSEVTMNPLKIQYKLFECGIYIKAPLLMQALSVLQEKKLITKPNE
jgi:hypothetical protein